MKIVLTVNRVTTEDEKMIVRFQPSLEDTRDGDLLDGELFLTTTLENAIFKFGDTREIELVPVITSTDSSATTETPTA